MLIFLISAWSSPTLVRSVISASGVNLIRLLGETANHFTLAEIA